MSKEGQLKCSIPYDLNTEYNSKFLYVLDIRPGIGMRNMTYILCLSPGTQRAVIQLGTGNQAAMVWVF